MMMLLKKTHLKPSTTHTMYLDRVNKKVFMVDFSTKWPFIKISAYWINKRKIKN